MVLCISKGKDFRGHSQLVFRIDLFSAHRATFLFHAKPPHWWFPVSHGHIRTNLDSLFTLNPPCLKIKVIGFLCSGLCHSANHGMRLALLSFWYSCILYPRLPE